MRTYGLTINCLSPEIPEEVYGKDRHCLGIAPSYIDNNGYAPDLPWLQPIEKRRQMACGAFFQDLLSAKAVK